MSVDPPASPRPAYLLVALVLLLLTGLLTLADGLEVVSLVREPLLALEVGGTTGPERLAEARAGAIVRHGAMFLPLGLAQAVVGAAATLAVFRAMIRRTSSGGFLQQAALVELGLLAIGFWLHAPVRAAMVDTAMTVEISAGKLPTADMRGQLAWLVAAPGLVGLGLVAAATAALFRRSAQPHLRPASVASTTEP